ncbi:hypothetical protein ASPZODRAFT_152292 [Penicilliopsis zonata CBS 506.65]|uniref:Copper transport protein n=1 Tax=Penicilliopsis zonata CBS 506.65 TaxID=1073090 RepID=A0A1L9SFW6_9EURO|nr:hypothetical protein ASPZODRAFT_152292 [Penicilliopsis zonata CBS 506.65]OJJ46061.1 hypothetical protein ASPZODRAFT_152292 [Penicilliopsis zonata CBS 506.65]
MSMTVVFQNEQNTSLYATAWTPSSSGSYAGTCIFLLLLSVLLRCLFAFKAVCERRWRVRRRRRRFIAIAGEQSQLQSQPDDAKIADESVRVLASRPGSVPVPWRLSVDLPRALIFLCISGVSYLLMLAVMTMNVGYFCSVLAGAFLGDLAVGRYITDDDH